MQLIAMKKGTEMSISSQVLCFHHFQSKFLCSVCMQNVPFLSEDKSQMLVSLWSSAKLVLIGDSKRSYKRTKL